MSAGRPPIRARRAAALVAWLTVLGSAASCAKFQTVPIGDLTGPSAVQSAHGDSLRRAPSGLSSTRGLRVEGYTTRDKIYHPFEGRARLVADTLIFTRPAHSENRLDEKKAPPIAVGLPVAELLSVDASREGVGRSRTMLFVLLGIFVVVLVASQGANTHGVL